MKCECVKCFRGSPSFAVLYCFVFRIDLDARVHFVSRLVKLQIFITIVRLFNDIPSTARLCSSNETTVYDEWVRTL